jgi:DNA-3-methyladenine glycosylase I
MTDDGRCGWADSDPAMRAYHDREWGVPLHDERALFELLSLEGAQAGLSWSTILKRREGYRTAFANFEIERVAQLDEADFQCPAAHTIGDLIDSGPVRLPTGIQHRATVFPSLATRLVTSQRTLSDLLGFRYQPCARDLLLALVGAAILSHDGSARPAANH